jgi:glutamyl-tRNA synthetase
MGKDSSRNTEHETLNYLCSIMSENSLSAMAGKVRVRFAPSPTGPLHMGGVRTALYNYLFAKKQGGDFILRIEDTDQDRFVPGAEQYIIEALKWCGIEPNEGVGFGDGPCAPYRQSERKEAGVYAQYAKQLIDSGNAYYAFDTKAELDAQRERLEKMGKTFSYNAVTRPELKNSLALSEDEVKKRIDAGENYVIRAKMPHNEEVRFHDLIRGWVVVHSSQLDDKVLFKSDGMPTYHLANVVDDYTMKITHVIRGEEWLPSAPLHVLLYRFLGWENAMPQFSHLPLLLRPDGNGKLSKRDGDRLGFPVFPLSGELLDIKTGLPEKFTGYRESGYYPEAFINMLAFLGWNPGTEQEIFSVGELTHAFSFEHIHKAGAKFDIEKAKWFNEQYLRAKPDVQIANNIREAVKNYFNFKDDDRRLSENFLTKAVLLLKPRVQFEHEMIEKGGYLFMAPVVYDKEAAAKKWKAGCKEFFESLKEDLAILDSFTASAIEEAFKACAAKNNLKPGEVLFLFRMILSGQGAGVDLMGMAEVLGREEVLERIKTGLIALAE